MMYIFQIKSLIFSEVTCTSYRVDSSKHETLSQDCVNVGLQLMKYK